MKRILVTGATGFVGRWLVPALLQRGHSVVAAGRDSSRMAQFDADVVTLDITRPKDFSRLPEGIDIIIHAAVERPTKGSSWGGAAESLTVNALGTLNLLQYAQDHHIKKMVYCSTMSVYALPQDMPVGEDGPTYPVNAEDSSYGISKLAGELLCSRGNNEGRIRCLCLRLGRIYGPGEADNSLFSQWAQQARNEEEIIVYGNGERSLDFVYIDDAIRAICLAAEVDWEGGIVNVSSGIETHWRNLAESIVNVFSPSGRANTIRYVNDGDKTRCYLKVDKVRQLLNFVPRYSLQEGLQAWKNFEETLSQATVREPASD